MNDKISDQLYEWLIRRSAGSEQNRIRAGGLISIAVDSLNLDLVEAREAFRHLRNVGRISYTADLNGLPFSGYLHVKRELTPAPTSYLRWQAVLEGTQLPDGVRGQLLSCHEMLDDLSAVDLARLAAGFKQMLSDAPVASAFSFDISAKYFLGASKVLDKLPEAAKRALGIAHAPATPRYIVVAGPSVPEAVLLIENTTTFEVAVRSGLASKVTLIAAYGYGLNMMMDSVAGWSLVDSISSGNYEVLSRLGGPHQLGTLFTHPNIYFWGDLDLEGLRIAHALRKRIPTLHLSGLYVPMIEALNNAETSHPYSKIAGKTNQAAWQPIGDVLFDRLAHQCASRAVDQEILTPDAIVQLGATALKT
jgi:hypothetical protein